MAGPAAGDIPETALRAGAAARAYTAKAAAPAGDPPAATGASAGIAQRDPTWQMLGGGWTCVSVNRVMSGVWDGREAGPGGDYRVLIPDLNMQIEVYVPYGPAGSPDQVTAAISRQVALIRRITLPDPDMVNAVRPDISVP